MQIPASRRRYRHLRMRSGNADGMEAIPEMMTSLMSMHMAPCLRLLADRFLGPIKAIYSTVASVDTTHVQSMTISFNLNSHSPLSFTLPRFTEIRGVPVRPPF